MHSFLGYVKLAPMKKAVQGILGVFLIGLLVFVGLRFQRKFKEESAEPIPATSGSPPSTGTAAATAPKLSPKLPPPPPEVSPQFTSYLAKEAPRLNATDVDVAKAEEEITTIVKTMGEAEINYARDIVLTPTAPANERIISAFLISRAGAKASAAQEDLMAQKLNSQRAEPHSSEELANAQMKAIMLMQVDAKAKEAETSQDARDTLRRWAASASDSTVRKAILDAIQKLPPLR